MLVWRFVGQFSGVKERKGRYRALAIDHENWSERDRFLYGITTFGPVVRVGIHF